MNVPIFRPECVCHGVSEKFRQRLDSLISRGAFIRGEEVHELENTLTNYLETYSVLTTANGTDALMASLMALDLKPGDEVITPAFGFPAAVEMMCILNIRPVLIDVNWNTCNMEPALLAGALSSRTKAILPIHLFGSAASMNEIMQFAEANDLPVIEDAAQSFGSECFVGGKSKKLGTIGDLGCTSFFPTKNLGCWGDGGAIFVNREEDELVLKIRRILSHGQSRKYFHDEIGFNSRLDTIQALVLLQNMSTLNAAFTKRKEIAQRYLSEFQKISEIELLLDSGGLEVLNLFTIKVDQKQRDALKDYLLSHGISARVYYPQAIHRQSAYSSFIRKGSDLHVSEQLANVVLSLPCFPSMTELEQEKVIDTVKHFFRC